MVITAACISILVYEMFTNVIPEFKNGQSEIMYVVNSEVVLEAAESPLNEATPITIQEIDDDFTDPYYDTGE